MDRVFVWLASRAWQGMMGSLGYRFRSLSFSLSLSACISESPSPFSFSSPHTHTATLGGRAVVLQQNTALIRHSAAGNYLHLFKLLFMPFVWRANIRLEVWTSSRTVIICFRKWLVRMCVCVCEGFLGSLNINACVYVCVQCAGISGVKERSLLAC